MNTKTLIISILQVGLLVALCGVKAQAANHTGEKPGRDAGTSCGSSQLTSCDLQITTLVVNTLQDELNTDGDCSLREAITSANNNFAVDACGSGSAASDTITFSVSGVINLNQDLTLVDGGPLVIDGGETITVSGQDSVRVFFINLGSQVTLRDLVVRDGAASDGAGMWNFGSLELKNVQVIGNTADYDGGGILNYEALIISDSLIAGNHASWGGGISNHGTLSIAGSTVSTNSAGVTGGGGGISNVGTLQITNSSMIDNSGGQGGAIHNGVFSLLSISFSSFINNTAYDGGGILSQGSAEITTSTFYGNSSQEYGGGVVNSATLSIINSTLTGNSALEEGGGIYSSHGTLILINCTLSSNSAGQGGGISNGNAAILYNTIMADHPTGGSCLGAITDGGHNLDQGETCGFEIAKGSLPSSDPFIGDLADNGGPTLTHALLLGSPAIDAAHPDYCPETDQRNVPRPLDGDDNGIAICDIGSVEMPMGMIPRFFLPLVKKD